MFLIQSTFPSHNPAYLLAALLVKLGSAAETSNNPGIVLWILGLQTTGTILLDVSGVGAKTKVLKLCSVMME